MDRSGAITLLILVGMIVIAGCSGGPSVSADDPIGDTHARI